MKALKLAATVIVLGTTLHSVKANAQNLSNPNHTIAQASSSQIKPANTNGSNSTVQKQVERGYELLQKDDYQGAIALFNKVLQTEQNNEIATYAYFGRGIAHFSIDKYTEAKSDFDQVINLDAKFARAYFFRAGTQYQLGNKKEAISDLNKAVSLFKAEGETELAKKAEDMIEKIQTS